VDLEPSAADFEPIENGGIEEVKGQSQISFSRWLSLKPVRHDGNSLIPYHNSYHLQAEKLPTLS